MKTIKDAIQASSIEQRRRILNNIGIDKDSKNFIVSGKANQSNGGGGVDDFYPTIYYKFLRNDIPELKQIAMIGGLVKGVVINTNYKSIAPINIMSLDTYEIIEAFSFNPFITEIFGAFQPLNSMEEFLLISGGNDEDKESINLILNNITRITKEEFYNLNN